MEPVQLVKENFVVNTVLDAFVAAKSQPKKLHWTDGCKGSVYLV